VPPPRDRPSAPPPPEGWTVPWSGVVTIVAIVYLSAAMRTHRLTLKRLAFSAAFYLLFAAGLAVILA
jgi:hypothetical protein